MLSCLMFQGFTGFYVTVFGTLFILPVKIYSYSRYTFVIPIYNTWL